MTAGTSVVAVGTLRSCQELEMASCGWTQKGLLMERMLDVRGGEVRMTFR